MPIWVLFDGLIGECAALLGSMSSNLGATLLPILSAIAATAILVVLGLMAQAAWLRFQPGDRKARYPFTMALILILAGVGVYIVIFSGVGGARSNPHLPHRV